MVRERRSLSSLGGRVRCSGDASYHDLLREAWAAADEDPSGLTHGFHTYPARMHPGMARVLVRGLSEPGERVLDPFCGGGTVIVEAMVEGRRALGVDLNPVAVALARVRCQRRSEADRRRFLETLDVVVRGSIERVDGKVRVKAPLPAIERQYYAPHVLLELAGLHAEIKQVERKDDRSALLMVFSSIVVKFAHQRSDTSDARTEKRIGRRIPTRFFERKGQELAERWAAVESRASEVERVFDPRVLEGDVRALAKVLGGKTKVQAVISSPPYGGTYDYFEHHTRRYRWLGMSPARLKADELGARRNLSRGAEAGSMWDREVAAFLESCRGRLDRGGRIALVMGDGKVGGRLVPADEQLARVAPTAGLKLVATASQARRGPGEDRGEHILVLQS